MGGSDVGPKEERTRDRLPRPTFSNPKTRLRVQKRDGDGGPISSSKRTDRGGTGAARVAHDGYRVQEGVRLVVAPANPEVRSQPEGVRTGLPRRRRTEREGGRRPEP